MKMHDPMLVLLGVTLTAFYVLLYLTELLVYTGESFPVIP